MRHPEPAFRGVAGGGGGGIHNDHGGTVNSRNSIIAGNANYFLAPGPDFYGPLTSQGYNLIGNNDGTIISGDATGNIVGTATAPVNPGLGGLGNNGGPTRRTLC